MSNIEDVHLQMLSQVLENSLFCCIFIIKQAIHYAQCVICMHDVCDSQIKGRITNHQQT